MLWVTLLILPSSEQTSLGSGQTPTTHLGEFPQSCRCQQWGPGKGWRGGSVDILGGVLPRPQGWPPAARDRSGHLRVYTTILCSAYRRGRAHAWWKLRNIRVRFKLK